MKKLSYYIAVMRLRTLPLSMAGIILGLMLAAADYEVNWLVVLFTVLTTACLQILTNISNELGDAQKGTDSSDRNGPCYTLTQGLLQVKDFKVMIYVYIALCIVFGLALIWSSFGTFFALEPLLMIVLGAAAISGAMRYTLGKNPYGYRGWGDLSVFLFFGLLSVLGSYFVAAHEIRNWIMLLPAVSIGLFSVGVLNINNIRDMKSDAATRVTVAIKMGEKKAKVYQTVLISLGWISMFAYALLRVFDPWHYLFVLTLPLFVMHLVGLWKHTGSDLDKYLPLLVMATFLFAILGGLGFVIYLF